MTNPFTKNIQAFKKRWPALGNLTGDLSVALETLPAGNGNVTARFHGILLHSIYDPVKEARSFAQSVQPGQRICLYGFGLGYHIEAILEQLGPDGALMAIELNSTLLTAAFQLRDLEKVACDPRFRLVTGPHEEHVANSISESLAWLGENSSPSALKVLVHIPSFQCMPPEFPKIANALEVLRMEQRVPAIFGNLESGNYRHNKNVVRRTPGLNTCRGQHENTLGLLLSAGPSLDGLRPYLKWLKNECVTGCVDTTLPLSSGEGIDPDYIFTLDPQDPSFEHFADCLTSRATLVFTPTANSRVVHWYQGKKVVVFKEDHSITRQETELMREKGTTQAGGSVSCLGLDCLIQMGCNPIILAGQDCAFSGGRSHASSTGTDSHTWSSTSALNPASRAHQRETQRSKQIRVDSCQGPPVSTSQIMYSYLRTLEQIAVSHPEVEILNLASHGAQIENLRNVGSVAELMEILKNRGMLEA